MSPHHTAPSGPAFTGSVPGHEVPGREARGEEVAMTPAEAGADPELARIRGVHFDGLTAPEPGSACDDLYGVDSRDGAPSCSHGPDPALPGVDVTEVRSVADLADSTLTTQDSMTASGIPCIDNGTSGNRVQAVYAVASDKVDRYGDVVGLIREWADRADSVFVESAAKTGGERHIRWVTDTGCGLVVDHVVLSPTGDDTFANTKNDLAARGYNRTDRKYLVWTDANVYCGIANLALDDSPYATNKNNGGNTSVLLGRLDQGCWGRTTGHMTEVHELTHLLGGVQPTALHGTSGGHCKDEYDLMCYADASGVTMTYPCGSSSQDWFLDCNNDDYFNTNPPAGSWLASHWNVANSSFLAGAIGTPTATTTTTTKPPTSTTTTKPPTSTTTTKPPTSTTTTTSATGTLTVESATFSGSLNRNVSTRTHILDVGTGRLEEVTTFTVRGQGSSSATVRVRIVAPDGTIVGDVTGPSGTKLSVKISRGVHSIVVSSPSSLRYTLKVRYPAH